MKFFKKKKRSKSADKVLQYQPHSKFFPIEYPRIEGGNIYHFYSEKGFYYEVRFGAIENSLSCVVNFNILNYEKQMDEYDLINSGEIFRVMATIIKIAKDFISKNDVIDTYIFSGAFKENENNVASIRTRFFMRCAPGIFDTRYWNFDLDGNEVIISKVKIK